MFVSLGFHRYVVTAGTYYKLTLGVGNAIYPLGLLVFAKYFPNTKVSRVRYHMRWAWHLLQAGNVSLAKGTLLYGSRVQVLGPNSQLWSFS